MIIFKWSLYFFSLLFALIRRLFNEVFFFISFAAYFVLWPIFWLIKQCPPLANRWYSFFMTLIYIIGGKHIVSLREKTLGTLDQWRLKVTKDSQSDENKNANDKNNSLNNQLTSRQESVASSGRSSIIVNMDNVDINSDSLPGQFKVLEVGPGFGDNFKYYPKGTKLTTIEINDYMEKNRIKFQDNFPNITFEGM